MRGPGRRSVGPMRTTQEAIANLKAAANQLMNDGYTPTEIGEIVEAVNHDRGQAAAEAAYSRHADQREPADGDMGYTPGEDARPARAGF